MALLSLFRKKLPDSQPNEGDFQSRAEGESADLRQTGSCSGQRSKRKSSRPTNEPVDPMLPEKKRARRRLVGAVALVLAAIIGLPMILDAEQKPLSDEVVIQIPSKDQASPTSRLPSVAPSAALSPSEEIVSAPVMSAKADTPMLKQAESPSSDSKPNSSTAVAPAKSKPTNTPDSKPDHRPAPKTDQAAAADSARAQAILNGDSAPAKSEKKNSKVVVQIAALASKEKVTELQDKLKAAGISSFTQTVATESGPRIRVRIGPFASKEAADTARGKLSKLGLNGTLVPS